GTGPVNSLPANDRTACRAFDGDTATRWGANEGNTQWVQVDLGQPYRASKVVLNWESAYADQYEVQVSPDGATWTSVHVRTDAVPTGDHIDTIDFATPVEGRFWRMQSVHAATAYGPSLYEFEVYGTKAPVGPAPTPVAGATVAKSTSYPMTYGDWTNGLLAGNGQQGIIVFGDPRDETVIFNDKDFFAARAEANPQRTFSTVASADLDSIRDDLIAGDYATAATLAGTVPGYQDGGEGAKHPGFKLTMTLPDDGAVANYYRATDYSDGIVSVNWSDTRGNWQRESFVSRSDDVTVQYLPAPAGTSLNVTLGQSLDPGMHLTGYTATDNSTADYLNIRVKYPTGSYDAGYEGVTRIVTDGTKTLNPDGTVTVNGASSVMLLTKTKRYNGTFGGGVAAETEWNQGLVRAELDAIQDDYSTLRARHAAAHSGIVDRVALDFGASEVDRAKTNERLLFEQGSAEDLIPALYERLFYAGRYLTLASSGATSAPDLAGNWTGDAGAGGDGYSLGANLALQIAGGNIGNMPEAMEGYFALTDSWHNDFETNATKLLGTSGGLLAGGTTPSGEGLISGLDADHPYQYATGTVSWLLYPLWEHYQITGDTQFLEDEYYPLIREMGDFYEDFLVEKDGDGKYIFAGSISPDNRPSGGSAYPALTVNSVYDIAGAKFALSSLIETATELGQDSAQIPVWQDLLDNLPSYIINNDGALAEWAWPDLANRDQYQHTRSSGLAPVWPFGEISPEANRAQYSAATESLARKDQGNYGNSADSLLHGALIAASLNNSESLRDKLLGFPQGNYYLNSLGTVNSSSNGTFSTSVATTVPTILMEMLAQSSPGTLDLLPALPTELPKGSIDGLLAKNQITIDHLEWSIEDLSATVTLTSAITQDLTLIHHRGIDGTTSEDIAPTPSPLGRTARILPLTAGQPATVVVTLADPARVNVALRKPALASSEAGTNTAGLAVDGDPTTFWEAAPGDSEWLRVDLGETLAIREIGLQWGDSFAAEYVIQTSTNGTTWTPLYAEDASDGDIDTVYAIAQARYVRVQSVRASGASGIALLEIEVLGFPVTNVALQKTCRAASVGESDKPCQMAFDGDTGTRWAASRNATHWIDVDLGDGLPEYYDIYRVEITWEAAYASSYRIQTSPDGVNWTDIVVATKSGNNYGADIHTFPGTTTRFVRMQGVTLAINYGYSIYEMRVYGAPHPAWVEKSALTRALNTVAALDDEAYTTSSWAEAFQGTLIADASALIDNPTAPQSDVDAAVAALADAIGSLVRRGDAGALTGLTDAVALLLPTLGGDYTEASVSALSDALTEAQTVLASAPDRIQAEIDAALNVLSDAVAALVALPDKTVL
ncbi:MAG: discoidin domain-containing protein, partial [Bifidobacteriaceae bacterium]|nr:discoidin domain-containing protein [Bifidobacteriaceae bacterium]